MRKNNSYKNIIINDNIKSLLILLLLLYLYRVFLGGGGIL